MSRLCRLVREKPDAVEADLRRFYGVTRAALRLREVAAFVRYLPPEAAIYGHGWTVGDLLLSDIFSAIVGKPHPSDPRVRAADEAKRARLAAGARRAARRREALGITGSVLRRETST